MEIWKNLGKGIGNLCSLRINAREGKLYKNADPPNGSHSLVQTQMCSYALSDLHYRLMKRNKVFFGLTPH